MHIHASCIAFNGMGVLLRGPPASGKSDLALRAIEAGAKLVADDLVVLSRRAGGIWASPLPHADGRLEVRGVGIVRLPALDGAPLVLLVDLAAAERLPDPVFESILNHPVRRIRLAPFENSAAIKLRLAAGMASEDKGLAQVPDSDDGR